MKVVNYSNKEKLAVLAKQKLTTSDIQILCDCGFHKAHEIRNEFKKHVVRTNAYEDLNQVFTDEFCEFIKLNAQRIEKYAKLGY